MKINEILYADAIPSISWNTVDISAAIPFDSIDGKNILQLRFGNEIFYLICDENKEVQAYVTILDSPIDDYYPLVRIENIAQIKGLISIIIFSLTAHKIKLIIQHTEELTPDGLKWLGKLLTNGGRGLIFKDQNGNPINFSDLSKEHLDAEISLRANTLHNAKTAILIENNCAADRLQKISENTKKWNSSSIIKPAFTFLNSKDLW